jgi:hypothetical protein
MVVEMLPMVKSAHLHTWVNCLTKLVVAATVWVLCDQVIVEVVLVTLIPVPCVQCLG